MPARKTVRPVLPQHPYCRCWYTPVPRGSPPPAPMAYADWLAGQDDETVRDILGKSRFELFKAGAKPTDFVNIRRRILPVADLPTPDEVRARAATATTPKRPPPPPTPAPKPKPVVPPSGPGLDAEAARRVADAKAKLEIVDKKIASLKRLEKETRTSQQTEMELLGLRSQKLQLLTTIARGGKSTQILPSQKTPPSLRDLTRNFVRDAKPSDKDPEGFPVFVSRGPRGPDVDKAIGDAIEKEVNASSVYIRIKGKNVTRMIHDGRFKTQFETGSSGGAFAMRLRQKVEDELFSYPRDLEDRKRPVYGYLDQGPTGSKNIVARRYGEVVVELKPEIKARSTFTLGDSLSGTRMPVPVLKPNDSFAVRSTQTALDDLADNLFTPVSYQDYWEVQIHGGVSLDDVAVVHYNNVVPTTDEVERLMELGIKWTVSGDTIEREE